MVKIVLAVFYAANSLFVIKYGTRHFSWSSTVAMAVAYWVVCIATMFLIPRIVSMYRARLVVWGSALMVAIASVALFFIVPQNIVRNDRYFMIQLFWRNMYHHINPYHPDFGAFSTNVPGAFPFYFLMTLPAYCAGEIGLVVVAGCALYGYCLARMYKNSPQCLAAGLLLVVTAISFWYEIPTRSTLFFNVSLAFWYVLWFIRKHTWSLSKIVVAGVLGGIVLSTRSIVAMPVAACYFFALKNESISPLNLFKIAVVNAIVFIVPIGCLWLWHTSDFALYNPLQVQSIYGHVYLFPLMLAGAWGVAKISLSLERFIFFNGALLLCITFGQYASRIVESGWNRCVFFNAMDVSYVVMALPFLAAGAPAILCKRAPYLA